jgi:SAM-dependent methyltransferase
MSGSDRLKMGMLMPIEDWLSLNGTLVFGDPGLSKYVAPFPPHHLMENVSGLTSEADFAAHGITIYQAIQNASPKPMAAFRRILDFGCGCGRLARLFKGYPGNMTGCDVDERHVEWINNNLSHMTAVRTQPNAPLPFAEGSFDAIISISVFSHLDEDSQKLYLRELARVSSDGACLFLTTHGERALRRALGEERIFRMLDISAASLTQAAAGMRDGHYNFILQNGHLTSATYRYGITFIPESYIRRVWSEFFEIVSVVGGAIHDFQDITVLRKRSFHRASGA